MNLRRGRWNLLVAAASLPAVWMSHSGMKPPGKIRVALILLCACGAGVLRAQEATSPQQDKPSAPVPASSVDVQKSLGPAAAAPDEHRFWDTTNDLLFAGIAASRTLDYFSTLNMRHRGRQEILLTNDVVDNHPAFVAIEVAGTATSIGVSYLFHRYGHHKLERWTSIVHIGLATTGSVRNYCLKTAHPLGSTPP
jgi:hypothetical protein